MIIDPVIAILYRHSQNMVELSKTRYFLKSFSLRALRRHKEPPALKNQDDPVKLQSDNRPNSPIPPSSSQHGIQTTRSIKSFEPQDLWQTAYDQLDEEKQRILSAVKATANPTEQLDEVINLTTKQYAEFQQNGNGGFRTSSRKIIDAALSFNNIIKAVAAFDPTQHAASAWAIVSLGLTVCCTSRLTI